MPEDRGFGDMAPATEGSHYALAYIRAAHIDDGSEALVYGATGAIGSAAVQIIKRLGAHVTAVCGSEQVELVAGLGADRVVSRTTTDFTADDERYDVVFDAVGKCSFQQCRKLLKPHGIWTSTDLGQLSQNPLLVLATRFSPPAMVSCGAEGHNQRVGTGSWLILDQAIDVSLNATSFHRTLVVAAPEPQPSAGVRQTRSRRSCQLPAG